MATLQIFRGDDVELDLGQIKVDDEVINLDGWEIFFTGKLNRADSYDQAVVRKSTGELGGVVVTDSATGRSRAVFIPSDTVALVGRTRLFYDVEAWSPDGKRHTVETGELFINEDISTQTGPAGPPGPVSPAATTGTFLQYNEALPTANKFGWSAYSLPVTIEAGDVAKMLVATSETTVAWQIVPLQNATVAGQIAQWDGTKYAPTFRMPSVFVDPDDVGKVFVVVTAGIAGIQRLDDMLPSIAFLTANAEGQFPRGDNAAGFLSSTWSLPETVAAGDVGKLLAATAENTTELRTASVPQQIEWAATNLGGTTAVRWIFKAANLSSAGGAIGQSEREIQAACTLKKFRIYFHSTTSPQNATFTLFLNGNATSHIATVTAGQLSAEFVADLALAAGDRLAVQSQTPGGADSTAVNLVAYALIEMPLTLAA